MPSLCEGPRLDQGKPPSTLTRTTTTQSLQSFQSALTTIHGHGTHRLEGPATPSVEQLQRMEPSVKTYQSDSLPVGFRQGPLKANRSLSKLFVHGRMFPSAPKHLTSRHGRIMKLKSLARLKNQTKKRSKAQSVETSADQPKLEPQSQKKKRCIENVLSRRKRDGICLRFPRKKVRQMKESRVGGQAGCWKCLVLKRCKSRRKSQQDDQRLKERNTIALESKRRWSWTPRSRKAKKTTLSAVASIDRVSSPSMTMPDLPAQLTSRVQEHHQNRPLEMKATKEGLQHQIQGKRRPLQENTSVNQPQHERETSRPSSLQRRIQRSPHEGLHHQSRE
jgi:hypothetical protein